MTKKRKISENDSGPSGGSPMKVEIKEESLMDNDYILAKNRLRGVLRQLWEKTDSDSSSDDSCHPPTRNERRRRHKDDPAPSPFRHTYVMKLFDRSVDLARFEEDTPLYPICRAWIQNQPRTLPQTIIKRRISSPEPQLQNPPLDGDLKSLPGPSGSFTTRIPSPLPEQRAQDPSKIDLNYGDSPNISTADILTEHRTRWMRVRQKWQETCAQNEQRYNSSLDILQNIYYRDDLDAEP